MSDAAPSGHGAAGGAFAGAGADMEGGLAPGVMGTWA